MRLLLGCFLFSIVGLASGCHVAFDSIQGSGIKVTDIRAVADFTKLSVSNSADVIVQIGDEQSVEVDIDDNLVDVITTEVSNGRLSISSNQSYSTNVGLQVRITVPRLEAVSISGSGDVTVTGLSNDEFKASITGSGDIKAAGTATAVEAKVTGSGTVDLAELHAETAEAKVTGSGDIYVCASKDVSARVTGSGDISYAGHSDLNPAVSSSVTGSGNVRKMK